MDDTALRVVGAVIRRDGLVLCARRAATTTSAGLWEFPGGKIEPGETPEAALVREIREELGVGISVHGLVSRHVTPLGARRIDLACYWAALTGTPPVASTDHDTLRWLEPSALGGMRWAPPDVPIVEDVRASGSMPSR
ncbi:(deoxy)nucleoside triphosphate pyrophosphohydrolase [Brachybacterium huguangmaarense]|uniref:8-oxo-dGTP diphosphatase n=1 Tax=Brachybacterium huguangmaarense TaxID=1652028 RepID=A0ABY6G300_9MICO|nr:(deoxy)nucleoside triphosphate pyrophosphohydrolase [Brachybacterium huguangmaarense]UYG17585.1 (deoxy)nucleoside triphosphate pyrophosphohydrolase [Brachybacterium huguangmaarense]